MSDLVDAYAVLGGELPAGIRAKVEPLAAQ
jgi:hypothetical protein